MSCGLRASRAMNCWSRASQPALNNRILKSAGPVHTLRLGFKRAGNKGQLHPQQNVGAGNDYIDGGLGNNNLTGGSGADTFFIEVNAGKI